MTFILLILHLVLAAFLLFVSLLIHGRVPGLTADESAVLGFLFFFGPRLLMLLIDIGTLLMSIYVDMKLSRYCFFVAHVLHFGLYFST